MTSYGVSLYNSFTYGEASRLTKSLGNFTATATTYSKVELSWSNIVGGYTAFRIVRSQEGYSETSEDGIILYEEFGINSSTGVATKAAFTDENISSFVTVGSPNVEITKSAPILTLGKPVFYTAWWLVGNIWSPIGYTYVVLPNQHYTLLPNGKSTINTHEKLLNLLPKIYTSKTNSPLDEIAAPEYDVNNSLISQGSDLYFYLKGISVSLDETLTYIDYLIPDFSGRHTIPSLVKRQSQELGFKLTSGLSLQRQKALIKNAIYLYSRKGTITGLEKFIESFTGLPTVVTNSPNIMLNLDDSSFKLSVGNWSGGSISKVTYVSLSLTSPAEPYALELTNCGQITGSATIANGVSSPISNGLPVVAGSKYTLTFYARKSTTTGTALPRIKWFDYKGSLISSSVAGSATTVQSSSWTKVSYTASAPGLYLRVMYAGLVSNVVTLGIGSKHTVAVGDSITVAGINSTFNGTFTVTAVTDYTISYAKTNANVNMFTLNPLVVATVTDGASAKAVYAGLEIDYGSGTYYMDFVQFSATSETYYYEPRGINAVISPKKTNYITNPSFEVDGTGWAFSPSGSVQTVTSSPKVLSGTKVYQLTTTSGSPVTCTYTSANGIVSTGRNFVFSIWAKTNNSTALTYSTTLSAKLNLQILSRSIASAVATITVSNTAALSIGDTIVVSGMATDYNGTFTITDVQGVNISYNVPGKADEAWTTVSGTVYAVRTISRTISVSLTNSWTKPEVNLFIPETWDYFATNITCTLSRASANGEILYLDAAQLEDGVTATDYFDGSYAYEYGASWATPNGSISYLYPNKSKMITALSYELDNFIPHDTPWLISTMTGLEAKGVSA
jgi:hypothetical protein